MLHKTRLAIIALFLGAWVPPANTADLEPVVRIGLSKTAHQQEAAERQRAGNTDLQMAVVVLDPGIPESTAKQTKQSIWPELRQAESIRFAYLIADALRKLRSFESVRVVPDTSLSADLYLTGKIELSDGERMRIRFSLKDITGSTWLKDKEAYHRVEVGWHLRHEGDGLEPFQPVYDQIAEEVRKALLPRIKEHAKTEKQNKSLRANGKGSKISEVDRIVMTRKALFAQYFSPERYANVVRMDGSRLKLQYLPNVDDDDWARIEAIRQRDEAFAEHVHSMYGDFVSDIQESYYTYQNESFAIARALRLSRRSANYGKVLGAILLAGAVAKAESGMKSGSGDRTRILAGLGVAALATGLIKDVQKRASLEHLNEVSRSFHDSVKSTRVEVTGEVIELTGTAQEQYTQWRRLLLDHHRKSELDTAAVMVVSDSSTSKRR